MINQLEELVDLFDRVRKEYSASLTLGELRKKLLKFDSDTKIILSDKSEIVEQSGSYRGYYEDIAFSTTTDVFYQEPKVIKTVSDFIKAIDKAYKNKVMYGYKGGEFPINKSTLVWIANDGCSNGLMLTDVIDYDDSALVIVKRCESR